MIRKLFCRALRVVVASLVVGLALFSVTGWAQSLVEEFDTDPVSAGRFESGSAETESSFTHLPVTGELRLVLDVDSSPAFYRSQPFEPIMPSEDASFSFRFRPEAFDARVEPTAVVGLVTSTPVTNLGDGLALLFSVNDNRLEVRANVENGDRNSAGPVPVFLELGQNYLAVAYLRSVAGDFAVEIFSDDPASGLRWVGTSIAPMPDNLDRDPLEVNRFGAQNAGDKRGNDIDQGRGSITLVVDELSLPARMPHRISLSPVVTLAEGDVGVQLGSVPVFVRPATGLPLRLGYKTETGTATPGRDYVAVTAGIIELDPGQETGELSIEILGDRLNEPDETFRVHLLSANRGALDQPVALVTIRDGDPAPSFSCGPDAVTVREGGPGTTTTFQLVGTLVGESEAEIVIPFNTRRGGGSATQGVDFVAASGAFVFLPFSNQAKIELTVIGDDLEEGEGDPMVENFFVDYTSPYGSGSCEIEIVDDDGELIIFVDETPLTEGDPGLIPLQLSRASDTVISFEYSPAPLTAGREDYRFPVRRHEIPANTVESAISFDLVDDVLPEETERFRLVPSNISPAFARISPRLIEIQIRDNDPRPVISLGRSPSTLEGDLAGNEGLEFIVRLDRAVAFEVKASFRVDALSATPGDDFVLPTTTDVTFAPGEREERIRISVVGDVLDEPNETIRLTLEANPVHGTYGGQRELSVTGEIRDDDPEPGLRVETPIVARLESQAGFEVPVRLSSVSGQEVSFLVSSVNGSAVAGRDFRGLNAVRHRIAAGQSEVVVSVPLIDDLIDEEDSENFLLRFSGYRGARSLIGDDQVVLTVLDDDDPPTLQLSSGRILEGNVGQRDAIIRVDSSEVSGKSIEFRWATRDDTAIAGRDYQGRSGLGRIPEGEGSVVLRVPIIGDRISEAVDEAFWLDLVQTTNASPEAQEFRVVIEDDDEARLAFEQEAVEVAEGTGGSRSVNSVLRLSSTASSAITFRFRTVDNGATAVDEDFVAISGVGRIEPGEQAYLLPSIEIQGDSRAEPDEAFSVVVDRVVGALPLSLSKSIQIVDDDTPTLLLPSVSVEEGSGNVLFEREILVGLDQKTGADLTVAFTTRDGTARAGADYVAGSGELRFLAGTSLPVEPIRLSVLGDDVIETNETLSIEFTVAPGVPLSIPDSLQTVTINDDELPSLSLQSVSALEGPAGVVTPFVFEVSLSRPALGPTSIDYTTVNGSAIAGEDFQESSGTLTFREGEMGPKRIRVQVQGDDKIEKDEDFELAFSNASRVNLPAAVTRGVIENDDLPRLIIESAGPPGGLPEGEPHTITIRLDRPAPDGVTVEYRTVSGPRTDPQSAAPGLDYIPISGLLVFDSGATEPNEPLAVETFDDALVELIESFTVEFFNPQGATMPEEIVIVTCPIIDNEQPILSIANVDEMEGDEGQVTEFRFAATLSRATDERACFDWVTAEVSATEGVLQTQGVDYVKAQGQVCFAPGETSRTVTVQVLGDVVPEPHEVFNVVPSNGENLTIAPGVFGRGTILNDDTSFVHIEDVAKAEGDAGATTEFEFLVRIEPVAETPVSLDWRAEPGSAESGADFVAGEGRVTFGPGVGRQLIVVNVLGDEIPEGDEVFSLELSNLVSEATVAFQRNRAIGTVLDDDTPRLLFLGDDTEILEGDLGERPQMSFSFQLDRAPAPAFPVSFRYRTEEGTATAGEDFIAIAGRRDVRDANEFVLPVSVVGDETPENDETLRLLLSEARNLVLTEAELTGLIEDDEPCFEAERWAVIVESCGQGNKAVDPDEDVTVNFYVRNNCATTRSLQATLVAGSGIEPLGGPQDFGRLERGAVDFRSFRFRASGQCGTEVAAVLVLTDEEAEVGRIRYPILLGVDPQGNQACCTIADLGLRVEPEAVELQFGEQRQLRWVVTNHGPSAATAVQLGVSLPLQFFPSQTDQDVEQLDPEVVLGDLIIGGDHNGCRLEFSQGSNLLFCNWDRLAVDASAELTVTVATSEPVTSRVETFSVFRLISDSKDPDDSNEASNMRISLLPAEGISLLPTEIEEGDPGDQRIASVPLYRIPNRNAPVRVILAPVDGTAVIGEDYLFPDALRQIEFPANQTEPLILPVPILSDSIDEGISESFAVRVVSASSQIGSTRVPVPISLQEALVTIVDDDASRLSIDPVSVVEPGEGDDREAMFRVVLDPPSAFEVTVVLQTFDQSAQSGGRVPDYEAKGGVVRFAPGQTEATFAVRIFGDTLDELTERFVVRPIEVIGASVSTVEAVGEIEGFQPPCVSIASVNPEISLEGDVGTESRVTVGVRLEQAMSTPVRVSYRTIDGTAIAGQDYRAVSGQLLFAPGELAKSVELTLLGDADCEGDESFQLILAELEGAGLCEPVATIQIRDDDRCIDLAFAGAELVEETCEPTNRAVDPFESVVLRVSVRNRGQSATSSALAGTIVAAPEVLSPGESGAFGIIAPGAVGSADFRVMIDGMCGQVLNLEIALREGDVMLAPIRVPLTLGRQPNGAIDCCETADLGLEIDPGSVEVGLGDSFLVGIQVTNHGPSTASGVRLDAAFTAPDQVDLLSATLEGQNCTFENGVITCPSFDMAPRETRTLSLLGVGVKVNLNVRGVLLARVTSETPDPRNLFPNNTNAIVIVKPPVGISVSGPETVDENGGSVDFTVTLEPPGNLQASVAYATRDGEAIEGKDYQAVSGRVKFDRLGRAQVNVPLINDTESELPESFSLALSDPAGGQLAKSSEAEVWILDDEPACIICEDVAVNVGLDRSSQQSARMTVRLTKPLAFSSEVQYFTEDDTAIAGADYEAVQRATLSFAAGQTEQVISIPIVRNTVEEADEAFLVRFANPRGARLCSSECRVTILDDPPVPLLRLIDVTGLEGSGGLTPFAFGLEFQRPIASEAWIDYQLAGGTAEAGLDYLRSEMTQRMHFSPGTLTTNLTFQVIGDLVPEDTEAVGLTITDAFNIQVTDSEGLATIIDDDDDIALPKVSIADAEAREDDGVIRFEIRLDAAAPETVMLAYSVLAGTAGAVSDYSEPALRSVVIPQGVSSGRIDIPIVADSRYELDESFRIQLESVENAELSQGEASGRILNDDPPPQIVSAPVSVFEGKEGQSPLRFELRLQGETDVPARFGFLTVDGTATAGEDYIANSGEVELSAGEGRVIEVRVRGDRTPERDEDFRVVLTEPVHMRFPGEESMFEVIGTILNDDVSKLRASGIRVEEGNEGETIAVFQVALTPASELPVRVAFATEDGTATNGEDYRAASGILNFGAGETLGEVKVRVIGDVAVEPDEWFQLSFSGEVNAEVPVEPVVATILDDDFILALELPAQLSVYCNPQWVEFRLAIGQLPVDQIERVEYLVDDQVFVSEGKAPGFDFRWQAPENGAFEARTRVIFQNQTQVTSDPHKIAVAKDCGEIAIVYPEGKELDEVFVVWDTLLDLGYLPRVFEQGKISFDELEGFLAVIWHDLDSIDLQSHTVEVFSNLQEMVNIPIYFMGTQLESSTAGLTDEMRDRWREMTKIRGSLGRVPLDPVLFGEEDDPNRGLVGEFWALIGGFSLEGETDSLIADTDTEVLAVAGDEESVLVHRFPSVDGSNFGASRRFVQAFPLGDGGKEIATFSRRVLFENALCFLLADNIVEDCECPSAVMSPNIAQQGANLTYDVGEEFSIDTILNNNGRCSARGGQLSVTLPPGLCMVGVESSKGIPLRWEENSEENTRTAYLAVGIVEPQGEESEDISLKFNFVATQPGTHRVVIRSTGNNFDEQTDILDVSAAGASIGGEVSLGIERLSNGLVNLIVQGNPCSAVRIESSPALGPLANWQLLETVAFSALNNERSIRLGGEGGERFYRAMEP